MPVFKKLDLPLIGSSYNFVGVHHNTTASIFLVEAEPGHGAPLHRHTYDEIILIQEGHPTLVLDNHIHPAEPGDIIVIKAETPHGFVNPGPATLKQIDIHLNPEFQQIDLPPTQASRSAGLPLSSKT